MSDNSAPNGEEGASSPENGSPGGAFAPLRERTFRRIWTASLFSNFGQLFLGVGAAWEMTRLTSSAEMVALVQSAMMLPLVVVTLPAGAIADMFDRRRIAMSGLAFSAVCAAMLAAIAFLDLVTGTMLLLFCALIGAGVALYSPSWQASIPEQVSRGHLPAAVALGTISYNVARSFGPALGGLIVVAYGARAVFGMTALLYLPLFFAFFLWQRRHVPSRLPPERMDRAMLGGARYALHAPAIRTALLRVFAFGLSTATASALAPLIARDMLRGDAATYGLLLGAQGVGAVTGALFVSRIREMISTEWAVRLFAIGTGAALAVIGFSHEAMLTCAAFLVVGACNILTIAMINVTVQLSAPRWVTARALSLFSSAITAGIGIGAWVWGQVAQQTGVGHALLVSGMAVGATALLGLVLPIAREGASGTSEIPLGNEPEVGMALTLRSGPVVIEVDYDVDPAHARDFYAAMMKMQSMRKRNGGFAWSIARDIADPALWTERYHCPTWGDYLRLRDRFTEADLAVQAAADAFHRRGEGSRVRRQLERPFGSVRWKAESYDPRQETTGWIAP
ncbi:MFS transporter [Sphingomonas sp. IC081]|uniref:MFS transporter n=1 Tax=Sphingomonas sp. IC081 TaxID=304378 RepID=UPI00115A74CB|nr:MFS transporter [Sphingomonas sp. IC081]QDK32267.1 MFS transporter [Sphingomonas sp. IC081]